jgi:radical SAM superfamily enzyme YgiQ (UPF0313 family)
VDILNVLFLTPLPGTKLWDRMEAEGRIVANAFPEDWMHYTLTNPVSIYNHLSRSQILSEMDSCNRAFYSVPRIARRVGANLLRGRQPFFTLAGNLSCRNNLRLNRRVAGDLGLPAANPA